VIVDETFALTGQGYRLTRVHHLGEHTLRVRVNRDGYEEQSHAVVEVLTPALTWTQLAAEPTPTWYQATPGRHARPTPDATALSAVADRLLDRGRRILRA